LDVISLIFLSLILVIGCHTLSCYFFNPTSIISNFL